MPRRCRRASAGRPATVGVAGACVAGPLSRDGRRASRSCGADLHRGTSGPTGRGTGSAGGRTGPTVRVVSDTPVHRTARLPRMSQRSQLGRLSRSSPVGSGNGAVGVRWGCHPWHHGPDRASQQYGRTRSRRSLTDGRWKCRRPHGQPARQRSCTSPSASDARSHSNGEVERKCSKLPGIPDFFSSGAELAQARKGGQEDGSTTVNAFDGPGYPDFPVKSLRKMIWSSPVA
jgi:hypothetical protein